MREIKAGRFLMGIIEILVGILLLLNPVRFTTGIIVLLGVVLIFIGIRSIVGYFRTEPQAAAQEKNLTTPDIMQPPPTDRETIEAVVLNILQQQQIASGGHSAIRLPPDSASPQPIPPAPHITGSKSSPAEAKLDTASLSAISDTLAAFRRH